MLASQVRGCRLDHRAHRAAPHGEAHGIARRSVHRITEPVGDEREPVGVGAHALGLGVGCEELGRPLGRIGADLAAELRADSWPDGPVPAVVSSVNPLPPRIGRVARSLAPAAAPQPMALRQAERGVETGPGDIGRLDDRGASWWCQAAGSAHPMADCAGCAGPGRLAPNEAGVVPRSQPGDS